ncbi:polyprenyl synthetase family protein [Streptomyces sp. NPDC088387]|uniref:polyprenyl synthetase family protein n=1 Tax=Streptomyces sp. NPDC088387 TaxID=3365859 RepID=UPI0038240BCF
MRASTPARDVDAVIRSDSGLLSADLEQLLRVAAGTVVDPGVPGFDPANPVLEDALRLALQAPNADAFAIDHARFLEPRPGSAGTADAAGPARSGPPADGVRPSTVYWAYRNYRGFDPSDETGADFATVRRVAASARLLMKAAVIIDDVQDGSDIRFGRPALHITHGVPLALNTACWMMTTAFQHVEHSEAAHYMIGAARNGFTGQALDMSTRLPEIKRNLAKASGESRIDFWKSVAALKTSTLLQLPVNAAALALDVPDKERALLDESMHVMGVAGQLLNDLVDFLPRYGGANSFSDFKGLKNRVLLELLATHPSEISPAEMTPEELRTFALNHPRLPSVMLRLADDAVRLKQTAKDQVFTLCRTPESATYFDTAIERVGHHINMVAERLHSAPSFDALLRPPAKAE